MSSAAAGTADTSRREIRTLTVIAAVHLVSHYYWLVFVPLLPMLKELLGVSYTELGLALTLMNIVSALTQAPIGFLVDRFGARLLLVLGVATGAAGFILIGLFPSYPVLLAAVVLVGLGNAVYHPADFSILSAEMSAARMGRAYSVHAFTGYLGFAAAPPVVLGLAWYGGAQFALIASGIIGVIIALPLVPEVPREQRSARRKSGPAKASTPARALLTPAILSLTLMFTTLNLATGVMQTYMVVALQGLLNVPQSVGNTALTTFLFTMVAGILVGGFIADKAQKQSFVATAGFGLSALCLIALTIFKPSAPVAIGIFAVAGLLAGIIVPSRDLLVKAASPPDAVGRVFGIVTTGFNFGGIIGPPIGGILIDNKMPEWIFYFAAIFMMITVVIALIVDHKAAKAAK